MITYTKLWILLKEKGMKRTDLKAIMSSATLAKLGKNEPVSSTVIEKICDYLKCQPGDIMENVTKEDIQKAGEIMNEKIAEVMGVGSNHRYEQRSDIGEFCQRNASVYREAEKGRNRCAGNRKAVRRK